MQIEGIGPEVAKGIVFFFAQLKTGTAKRTQRGWLKI
jgi:hypothetical protein